MQEDIILKISEQLNIKTDQIRNTLKLLEDGCTVPFIARYRKELTHGLDEEQIRVIQEQYDYQVNLKKRKEEVEVKNNAESLIYNSQKTLDELGDKVSSEEKAKVQTEIDNLKKKVEGNNIEEIKEGTDKLTKVFYEISEKLYKANGANAGAAEGQTAGAEEAKEGEVYDADYKVEDENKDDNK